MSTRFNQAVIHASGKLAASAQLIRSGLGKAVLLSIKAYSA